MPKKSTLEIKKASARKKPYYFSIPSTVSSTGKRERKFFETRKEAQSAREVELVRVENFGLSQATLPSEVRRDAARAGKLLKPHGVSLYEAVKQFVDAKELLDPIECSVLDAARSHLGRELERAKSCTFAELMAEFIESKNQEQASKDYLKQIRLTEKAFQENLGPVMTCELTTKMVREALGNFETKLATYSAHLRVLKAAFSFGIQHEYLVVNPASRIKHPKQAPREVKILSNRQVRALLEAATEIDPEMLPYFAIGIFAGLRPTELQGLDWQDVDLSRKEIFVRHRNANSKERVGRSVPIETNLVAWLQRNVKKKNGNATPSANLRKRFEAIRARADEKLIAEGLKPQANLVSGWKQDCMRHTAASHWDASTGNIAQTALRLGHTEPVHRKHYYHPVQPDLADEFWSIVPSDPKRKRASPLTNPGKRKRPRSA